MNKLKKMFVIATGAALVTGLAFSVAAQTADAAKKCTVTVKNIGDDKKTLKAVKKTVKAGTKYKLAKLSTKDKATHNYGYKSGLKIIKVTKGASCTVSCKRTAYDVKFNLYKDDASKIYKTVIKNVKKGKSVTYTAAAVKNYKIPAKGTIKPKADTAKKLTYTRTAYDIKFVTYKADTGKTYATSKVLM